MRTLELDHRYDCIYCTYTQIHKYLHRYVRTYIHYYIHSTHSLGLSSVVTESITKFSVKNYEKSNEEIGSSLLLSSKISDRGTQMT